MADRGSKIRGVDLPHGREGEGIFALNDNAGNQNRREILQQVAFPSSVLSSGRAGVLVLWGTESLRPAKEA